MTCWLAWACSCAVAAAVPERAGAGAFETRLQALARDGGIPPAEVLEQLAAWSSRLPAESAATQDLARLTEVRALLDIGQVAAADQRAQSMLAESKRLQQPLALVRAQLAVLRVRLRQSDIKSAAALAREILARRSAFEQDELSAEVFAAIGNALSRAGEHEPALALLIEGLQWADRFQRTDQTPLLLIALCGINVDLQNPQRALDYCRQAAALADQTGNKMARAAAAINLSLAYAANGDAENQLAELQRSLALSREMGLKRAEGMARINLAEYVMTRGDLRGGLEHCREGLRIGRELADPIMIAVSLTNLGLADAELGDLAGGIASYEQGLQTAEAAGEMAYVVNFLPGMAQLYESAGRFPDALNALRRRIEAGDKLYQQAQADALSELQSKYDADTRKREIEMLTLDNRLKSAALDRRNLQARVYWLLGAVLVLATVLLLLAYRRVRTANRKLAVVNNDLEQHSLCDPLTGLFNRRALTALLDPGAPGHPRRQPLPPMAFVMIDADHFKSINDRFGHSVGDTVLVELGQRLGRLVRPDDRLFRLGGEEFLLLLPGISNGDLTRVCQRILLAVNQTPVTTAAHAIPVTVSLGACPFPLAPDPLFAQDWQRHLHLADLALYQAKSTGRDRACQILHISAASEAMLRGIESDFATALAQRTVHALDVAAGSAVDAAHAVPLADAPPP